MVPKIRATVMTSVLGHGLGRINRHRSQGHGPGLWVYPLKGRGLPECNGLARGFRAVEACAGCCRFIGQINQDR